MNRFYVYIYFRPWNGIPCYVGKGQGKRWLEHLKFGVNHYNKHFAAIFAKAKRLGMEVPRVKIRVELSNEEAVVMEIAFIKAIGRADKGLGPLVNWTDGGDGTVGYSPSEEAREKVRQKLKNRPKTPEHCAAVSAAKKGIPHSRPMSNEQRKAIADKNRGQKRSIKAVANMKQAAEKIKNDPVRSALKSARITAKLTGKCFSAEHRKNIGIGAKGAIRSPQFRLQVSKTLKMVLAIKNHGNFSSGVLSFGT